MKVGMAGASVMLLPWIDGIRIASDLGYDGFEIFGESPQAEIDFISEKEREEGKRIAEELGIELLVHCPFNNLNIASLNRGVREESVRQYLSAVDFCAKIGAKVLVVHNGEYIIDPTIGDMGAQVKAIQWQLNLDALKRISEKAEGAEVIVCLENCNFVWNKIEKSIEDLVKIKQAVGSENLKFTLDIGHSRLAEGVNQALKVLGKEIRHIHFTDNFGKQDDHLIIGEGNFDYSPFLDFFRSFPFVITLEVVKLNRSIEPAKRSLENFRKIINKNERNR